MENIKSWDVITSIGESVQKRWAYLASLHKVNINITGIPSLSSFTFSSSNHQAYKTFLTQEMLKKGFLAGTLFYASVAHEEKYLENYFTELDSIFEKIKKFEADELQVLDFIEGPIVHSGFKRLN